MHASAAFHTIGIISRPRRSNLEVVVPPLLHWFAARGIRTLYDTETAGALHDSSRGLTREEVAEQSQLLLVLGGDGTLLAAARVAARLGIPILPINMGSLGFLTSFTIDEMYPALEQVLAGRFSCSERVMLDVELHRDGDVIERQSVVNESVINKGALARMIDLPLPRRRLDRGHSYGVHRLLSFRRRPDRPSRRRVLAHHPYLPAHVVGPPSGR